MSQAASIALRAVLDHGPVARSTIARLTGLSPAAVTRQCAGLTALGLVRELPAPASRMGRPHIPLDIDPGRYVAGLHIALDYCTLAAVDLRGRMIAQEQLPHPSRNPAEVLGGAGSRLGEFLARHTTGRPLGLGVAAGGWVDPAAGVIVAHEPLGWQEVPVRELVAEATGLPVMVDGHSRSLVLAERMFGAARGASSVVHLFVGNVVDAGIMTSGTVHHGPRAGSGDVAHLPLGDPAIRCGCGRNGCFQAAVSEWAVAERAAADGVISTPSFPVLLDAALDGNPAAVEIFRARARLVGRAAALLYDVLNPEVLVITEAGVLQIPGCLDELRSEIAATSHLCAEPQWSVVPTSFRTPDVLGIAAAAVLLNSLYTDPFGVRDKALAS